MHSYKDFIVWQKAIVLAKKIYQVAAKLPTSETYGLASQLRRASVSVPSNIAEGFSRKSAKENHQFLTIAFGSTSEIETQLILARDLEMIADQDVQEVQAVLEEVRKMLYVLIQKFRSKS